MSISNILLEIRDAFEQDKGQPVMQVSLGLFRPLEVLISLYEDVERGNRTEAMKKIEMFTIFNFSNINVVANNLLLINATELLINEIKKYLSDNNKI